MSARQPQPLGGRPALGERIERGWREAGACWDLMSKDPYLLILPAVSLVFVCLTWAGLFLVVSSFEQELYLQLFLVGVLGVYPFNFLGTFFGVAFLAVADGRLRGEDTTIGRGLSIARRKAGAIARWALIASGFGLLLQLLQQAKADWIASPAVAWLAGAAWTVVTFFVVPVLAFEDRGGRDALRRSAQIVKERWGEGLGGVTNLAAVSVLGILGLGVVGAILVGIGFGVGAAAGFAALAIMGVLFAAAMAAITTGSSLLALALYRVATGGPAVGFDQQVLQEALVPRRRRWRPWRR